MTSNLPSPSGQARVNARRLNAAHSAADGTVSVALGRCDISKQGLSGKSGATRFKAMAAVVASRDCALGALARFVTSLQAQVQTQLQSLPPAALTRSATNPLPNPSLERTSTGKPFGPRGSRVYAPPRGPSAFPVGSAQLKR
jgi:hypothetical protein